MPRKYGNRQDSDCLLDKAQDPGSSSKLIEHIKQCETCNLLYHALPSLEAMPLGQRILDEIQQPTDDCPDEQSLWAYITGTAPEADRILLESHLKDCLYCMYLASDLISVMDPAPADAPDAQGDDFLQSLTRKLRVGSFYRWLLVALDKIRYSLWGVFRACIDAVLLLCAKAYWSRQKRCRRLMRGLLDDLELFYGRYLRAAANGFIGGPCFDRDLLELEARILIRSHSLRILWPGSRECLDEPIHRLIQKFVYKYMEGSLSRDNAEKKVGEWNSCFQNLHELTGLTIISKAQLDWDINPKPEVCENRDAELEGRKQAVASA